MKVSILITTYDRNDLLKLCLPTVTRQVDDSIHAIDVHIINDYLPDASEAIAKEYGVHYIYTGQRNEKELLWRCPGFAINYAAKRVDADIIIISCAEIYHLGNAMPQLLAPYKYESRALAIPHGIDDQGKALEAVRRNEQPAFEGTPLKTTLPFLMAMRLDDFINIGGYDEDFIGQSYDDDDLVDRLQNSGCHIVQTSARCIHLYHPRNLATRSIERVNYNRRLFEERRGRIVRNVDKEWGNG